MKHRDKVPFLLVQIIGFIIAAATGNIGNSFIFLGLASITIYSSSTNKINKTMFYLGQAFYLIGFIWSIFQPLPLALGWGSVFATLFIGNIDFSKNLKKN